MSLGHTKRITNWVLVIDLLYGHDLDSALNYSLNGGRSLFSKGVQVRAGSVIFLVGVGSLVCWKIWDYWNSGGDPARDCKPSPGPQKPSGKTKGKTPTKEAKAFFASFLEEEFVHDFEEFENEDPALIQQLLDLGRLYIKKIIVGKYFGPESPTENRLSGRSPQEKGSSGFKNRPDVQASSPSGFKSPDYVSPVTSEFSAKTRTDSGHQYLADNSESYSADEDEGSMTSDYEGESLPFDGHSEPLVSTNRRRERRRYKSEGTAYAPLYKLSPRSKGIDDSDVDNKLNAFVSRRFHPYERSVSCVDNDFSSSEASPRGRLSRQETCMQFRQDVPSKFQRHLGDGSETPDSDEVPKRRSQTSNSASRATPAIANNNSDSDWVFEGRLQPDGQEMRGHFLKSLSRDVSLSDLMGRLRPKSSRRSSLSRENSVSSRLSDFLRRDDSICSNLSDFAASECSEFSLELSIKDEAIAHHTISSLADIEDELNTLKSSVLEIDEEFIRFASRPNPYLLKTTFSDYSIDSSSESRPGSALEGRRYSRSLSETRMISECSSHEVYAMDDEDGLDINFNGKAGKLVRNEKYGDNIGATLSKQDLVSVTRENLEDNAIFLSTVEMRKKALKEGKLRRPSQDDQMPSLEWDNSCCLKQYEEALSKNVAKSQLDRLKFLPDHASLELDLERELQFSSGPNQPFCGGKAFASSLCPPLALISSSPSPKPLDHSLNESKHQPDKVLEDEVGVEHQQKNMTPPTSLPLDSISKEGKENPMTTSVDSAIHSAPASRSGSSSPVPQLLTQSMMSSGIATSWTEICSETPDSETGTGYKLRKSWLSEESGYVEDEVGLEGSTTNLSPVHELREKEFDEKNSFRPEDEGIINRNVNVFHQLPSEDPEINGNSGDTANNNRNDSTMGNTTSTPYKGGLINSSTTTQPVGEKVDIVSYAAAEWQGNTPKAQTIRQGYNAIPAELKLGNLRRIRGDNYCGIRASLYQILSSGVPVPNGFQVFDKLVSEVNNGSFWLKDYSFGRRITYSKDQVVSGFKECLEELDKLNLDLIDCENRENVLLSRLCHDSQLDVKLCEAAKLHMLACAIDLYKEEVCGGHVPLFGMIMFARQSCLNPKEFMVNHLNPVGDTAGLEQIEMFLLGHAFQVTLQVVRPSCYGGEDFICFYPDENIGVWPEVNLVAEDDRHYNVLVK